MNLKKLNLNQETLRNLNAKETETLVGGISRLCTVNSDNICASDFPVCRTHVASNCHPCW